MIIMALLDILPYQDRSRLGAVSSTKYDETDASQGSDNSEDMYTISRRLGSRDPSSPTLLGAQRHRESLDGRISSATHSIRQHPCLRHHRGGDNTRRKIWQVKQPCIHGPASTSRAHPCTKRILQAEDWQASSPCGKSHLQRQQGWFSSPQRGEVVRSLGRCVPRKTGKTSQAETVGAYGHRDRGDRCRGYSPGLATALDYPGAAAANARQVGRVAARRRG